MLGARCLESGSLLLGAVACCPLRPLRLDRLSLLLPSSASGHDVDDFRLARSTFVEYLVLGKKGGYPRRVGSLTCFSPGQRHGPSLATGASSIARANCVQDPPSVQEAPFDAGGSHHGHVAMQHEKRAAASNELERPPDACDRDEEASMALLLRGILTLADMLFAILPAPLHARGPMRQLPAVSCRKQLSCGQRAVATSPSSTSSWM